jgi:hypothetical protein
MIYWSKIMEKNMAAPHRNKAHTATVNRLAERYHGHPTNDGEIVADEFSIFVTTTATLADAVEMLNHRAGQVYVAITNREGVREAVRATEGTHVGVMRPDGEIVKPSTVLDRPMRLDLN